MSCGVEVSGEGLCGAILIGLGTISNPNDPQVKHEQVGGIQALKDPTNTSGNGLLQVVNDPGSGHRHLARIKYKTRGLKSAVTSSKSCGTGTEKTYNEVLFEPCTVNEVTVTMTYDKVRRYCEAASELQAAPITTRNAVGQMVSQKAIMRELWTDIQNQGLEPLRQKNQ